jgi:Protein of unknown function (DUF3040)
MLSEYERRQLALIEKGFADEDQRLVAALDPKPAGTPWTRRRWMARALLGFGIALLVLGMLTAADGLFMQGLVLGGIGGYWLHWQRRAARKPAGGDSVPRGQAHPV